MMPCWNPSCMGCTVAWPQAKSEQNLEGQSLDTFQVKFAMEVWYVAEHLIEEDIKRTLVVLSCIAHVVTVWPSQCPKASRDIAVMWSSPRPQTGEGDKSAIYPPIWNLCGIFLSYVLSPWMMGQTIYSTLKMLPLLGLWGLVQLNHREVGQSDGIVWEVQWYVGCNSKEGKECQYFPWMHVHWQTIYTKGSMQNTFPVLVQCLLLLSNHPMCLLKAGIAVWDLMELLQPVLSYVANLYRLCTKLL